MFFLWWLLWICIILDNRGGDGRRERPFLLSPVAGLVLHFYLEPHQPALRKLGEIGGVPVPSRCEYDGVAPWDRRIRRFDAV